VRKRNTRRGKRECCGILFAASTRRIKCRNAFPEENREEEGFNSCETQIESPAPLFLPERRYAILANGVLAIWQNRVTFSFSSSPLSPPRLRGKIFSLLPVEPLFQTFQLLLQCHRELGAELVIIRINIGNLILPAFGIDRQQLLDIFWRGLQAG